MSLITEYSTSARPDRGLVEVYDSDAYLGSDEAFYRSRTQVVAGDGYHLYLQCLQPDIAVQVVIRVWDTPQKPPEDAEGTVPVSLESETGQLVINQLSFGPAGTMDLPRPGVYDGHAAWSGRETTAAYYNTCTQRGAEEQWDDQQIGAAWRQCPTAEQYTLDLWFVRESEPEGEWDE
ncbi:hypothetical protein ACFQ7J_30490 [Streptomyces sp. NPDC056501]|uniref:hypothetical protein n=1 Tax=Streptomyces sp. NPDC056501 TaxID=3345841 RepID=UPI00367B2E49